MAIKTFTIKDAHKVMNQLAREATGQKDISVVDTASFIDAGTKTLEAGIENLYNALGVLIGRTINASRPYNGKFGLVVAEDSNAFDSRVRKISFYARDNEATGAFNTDIYPSQLGKGEDDESGAGSMWEQNPAIVASEYFFSNFAWSKSHTEYYEQAKIAFQNEADFVGFINGCLVEVFNDIETTMEAKNRSVVIDRMAGNYILSGDVLGDECSVNLTKEFNTTYNTNYTTNEILTDHAIEFLQFFIARFKIDSDKLENRTALYHDSMEKTINGEKYHVLRHTPKSLQKFIYYSPIFTQLNMNLSNIFNPEYLSLPNGEGVQYWQSFKTPSAIDVMPALPEGKTSSEVKIPLVIGLLFDRDAIMVNNKFKGMYQTQINPKHLYTNMFWHYNYSVCQSYSENSILYYMSDEDSKVIIDSFTGDGTETDFELNQTATTIVKVTVNGVEVASEDYSFANNTVTFDTAPADESVIVITYK